MKKFWLLVTAVCGKNITESKAVKENRFTLNLAEIDIDEMFRFQKRNNWSKMSATIENDGTHDYLRIDAQKLAKVAYKDGPTEYGEMWYLNGYSELANDYQVYCLGLDVALFRHGLRNVTLSLSVDWGYDDDDNDYNRQLFKINAKNATQDQCEFDILDFEQSFCIDHSDGIVPTWTRIETRSFKPKSKHLQLSFMTKKPSLIGIRNMTLEDCTNENLSQDEIAEQEFKIEEAAMLATMHSGERALYLAQAADREYLAKKKAEAALKPVVVEKDPVDHNMACQTANAKGKKGYWNTEKEKWVQCVKPVAKPTKASNTAKRVTLPSFLKEKLANLGFNDDIESNQHNNHDHDHNQQQNHQQQHQQQQQHHQSDPNNYDQSNHQQQQQQQHQYDPNDSRYVRPGGEAKRDDNDNGFKITRDNYETTIQQMMSDIELWKIFHEHIHNEIAKQPNKTAEADEKSVKPRNREISMFDNTPVVKTTKAPTTRPSLPFDWNPPGNANIFKPDLAADPDYWFKSQQLYMTTEAMVELIVEMEEFNERVKAQERDVMGKTTSSSINTLINVLVIALFAV